MQVNLSTKPKLTGTTDAPAALRRAVALAFRATELRPRDVPDGAQNDVLSAAVDELYALALHNGPTHGPAAHALLEFALSGALMLPADGPSLRELAPMVMDMPAMFAAVDEYVIGESPRWLRHDTHFKLLLATDCRHARQFDIHAFEKLHAWLVANGTLAGAVSLALPAYMTLRGIELCDGSALGRDLRHGYVLWRASESDKVISFVEFMSDPKHLSDMRIHGHARERIELAVHQDERKARDLQIKAKRKVGQREPAFIQNLRRVAEDDADDAPEEYFGALTGASKVKGFRPEFWIEEPVCYPGREAIAIAELGRSWFIAFRAFLAHRQKDYETDGQVRTSLHVLADYLLLYLPWWRESHPETRLEFPASPKQFLRYYYVDRTRFHNEEEQARGELPKTFNELLPLRKPTPDSRNTTRIILQKFFSFVLTYFEDSEEFVNRGMQNPIRPDFDNEVSGRRGKTNKVPFAEDVFPFLVHYGQAVEAFGEFLQQLAYERNVFREQPSGPREGYETGEWGYVPIFWYRGRLFRVDWLPRVFLIAKRTLRANPDGPEGIYVDGRKFNTGRVRDVTLNFPHLTVVRLLNAMAESGLRAQSIQWLDRRTFDSLAPPGKRLSDLYGSPLEQSYHALYVNTDKAHEAWNNLVSWRVRRSLLAEKFFQDSAADGHVTTEVKYEDRENSRFLPIVPLFRSDRSAKPISDSVYSYRWVEYLFGFQKFYNRKDGEDRSGQADALELLVLREGSKESDPLWKRYLAIHTPHACRATYATLKDGDLEVSEIAEQLGHSNTAVTNTYQVPNVKRLTGKLKKIDDQLMGSGAYDPSGQDDGRLHPEKEDSSLRLAFNKDRAQAILDFGFVPGVALWSLTELDGDTSTLELLRQSPSSLIRWHATHVCPVGNQCPKEVVANTGGMNRCGICPLAAKCVDHLPAIEAKQSELQERIRTAAARLKRLTAQAAGQSDLDVLHREMQHDTKEMLGWKLSAEILRAKQKAFGVADVGYHVDQPELVRKQLQLVSRNQSESEFFLQRIADSNAYPSLESAEVRAKASRYTRLLLARQGRLEEAAFLDVQPHTELAVFASLVKPFVDARGLTIADVAAAIDALPRTVALAAPNMTPLLSGG